MKAAASEVGIDPALVERAARLLPAKSPSSPFDRLIGGPLRQNSEIHLPVKLDEARAAQLLAAVQISAGQPGNGHSSAIGMVWHARDDMEGFSVTAQPEEGGTSIAVTVDRRGMLALVSAVSFIALVSVGPVSIGISQVLAPEFGAAAGVSGLVGVLALGRWYWASSTRKVRDRVTSLMDAISRAIAPPE